MHTLADRGRSRGFETPPHPLLENNVKGFNPRYKIIFESGVKFTGNELYFYQKLIFSRAGMYPDPHSYGISDVKPHLT